MAGTLTSSSAQQQKKSTVAIISIIAAVGGIIASLMGHPYWGMFMGIGAIVLGSLGFGMAASPRVSGGLLSVSAIVLSIIGLGISILVAVGILVF